MASKLFLVDLDLNLNKAKNFRLEDFSTDPSTSLESGRLVYFTGLGSSQNHFKVYNGTDWKTIAYTDDVPDISISLDAPDLFSVSGSPADASGTLSFEWNDALANTVLAGPETGSSEIPTFRSLVDADIPVEIARVSDVDDSLDLYIPLAEKGEPLGVAELDVNGVVPEDQLDLTNYVTVDDENIQYINGSKFFTGGLLSKGGISIWSDNFETTPSYNGHGLVIIDDTSENLILDAREGMGSGLGGDIVLVSTGQYLNSVDPDNQIATIGDINSEGVNLLTGTTNQITVSGDGTGDVTLSFPDNVNIVESLTIGGDLTGSLFIKDASDRLSGEITGLETTDASLSISNDAGGGLYLNSTGSVFISGYSISLSTNASGDAYVGSISAGNEIATHSYVEALPAYDITSTQISNWDTSYGWGDHSVEGYLTTAVLSVSNTDSNIVIGVDSENPTIDLATDIEIDGDLIVGGNLTVSGDVTTLNTETLLVEDNIVTLNSNVTGTPSVDSGIEVERGTSTNASLIWDESGDVWQAGLVGSEKTIARKFVAITTGTTHTVTHGLATSDVTVNCWLDGAQVEANIVVTDSNTVTVTTNSSTTNLKTVVVG
jgi:hypothetical protein